MADVKLVIAVRRDLRLSPGKLAAQVGHASVMASNKSRNLEPMVYLDWLNAGQKKVVVKVASERELFDLKERAEKVDLLTALVTDAGHTELPPGTVTCLAVGPAAERDVDKVTGDLALY